MKIFKKLNKLGYIHYSATTIEELDDLPLNSAERISEQALVLRWFREKYKIGYNITWNKFYENTPYQWEVRKYWENEPTIPYGYAGMSKTYEEAELACLKKLIKIAKNK